MRLGFGLRAGNMLRRHRRVVRGHVTRRGGLRAISARASICPMETLPRPSGEVQPLRAWFEKEGPEGLSRVSELILDRLPGMAESGLHDAVASHLPLLTGLSGSEVDPDPGGLPGPVLRYVKSLALEGVPLDTLLRSFELGHAEIWGRFAAWLRDGANGFSPEERARALELSSLRMFDYFMAISAHVVTVYTREQLRREKRANTRRAEVIAAVLAGSIDEATASECIGYRFGSAHIGFVAWARNPADCDRLDALATEMGRRLGAWQSIWVPDGQLTINGWFSVDGDEWKDAARSLAPSAPLGLTFGGAHTGAAGFRTTHREAREARRVADISRRDGPTFYDDVAVTALASHDPDLAASFVDRFLGKLLADEDSCNRLLPTLRVYLDQAQSPTRTARQLNLHTNTVVKRIERIESLLGAPIENNLLPLRVAVELAALTQATE